MVQALLSYFRSDNCQRLLFAARDLDHHETVVLVFVLPPDQVVPKGGAVLSEVEVQPSDFALQFFEGKWLSRLYPMGLFRDDFRWPGTQIRVTVGCRARRASRRQADRQDDGSKRKSRLSHVASSRHKNFASSAESVGWRRLR
jgi:hypothetical protein